METTPTLDVLVARAALRTAFHRVARHWAAAHAHDATQGYEVRASTAHVLGAWVASATDAELQAGRDRWPAVVARAVVELPCAGAA